MPATHAVVSPGWRAVDLISDLHLHSGDPATFALWRDYMLAPAPEAEAVFILGDLFEVWVGDDNQDPFALKCIAALKATAQRMPVYFMCGNRDFLVGRDYLGPLGVVTLTDPTLLEWGAQRLLLTHGDALCLGDTAYQVFRQQVRSNVWQRDFLSKPLPERLALARAMRQQSQIHAQKPIGKLLMWP